LGIRYYALFILLHENLVGDFQYGPFIIFTLYPWGGLLMPNRFCFHFLKKKGLPLTGRSSFVCGLAHASSRGAKDAPLGAEHGWRFAKRLFALVDVWDALSSERPYRNAMPKEEVLEYIRNHSGTHFDPSLVDVFIELIKDDSE